MGIGAYINIFVIFEAIEGQLQGPIPRGKQQEQVPQWTDHDQAPGTRHQISNVIGILTMYGNTPIPNGPVSQPQHHPKVGASINPFMGVLMWGEPPGTRLLDHYHI